MHFNKSNRLFLLLFLFTAGCAQQQKTSLLSIDQKPPTYSSQDKQNFSHHYSTQDAANTKAKKPVVYANVWERIIALYSLPKVDNQRIDREIKRYLKKPENLVTIQERAEPYLYAIIEEIESKNLPGELALLPVIESAFKPQAYSRSKASGLWQFIPATGRFFGLKQNWWYDGRRDIHASTQVATSYLKELNEEFDGDWFLALASYNAGKGNVGKAIKKNQARNKPTDYWSLPLPKETRHYVPKLLAVARIFANAEKYNIRLRPIPNEPVFESVDIGSQLGLAKAAEMANIPMEDFYKLNPAFNRLSTAPDGPHRLLIPIDQVESFKENLSLLPDDERMRLAIHKVRRGENLSFIANKYGTTTQAIHQANQLSSNVIYSGDQLFIPSTFNALNNHPDVQKRQHRKIIYIVKRGDTFWEIARKFSVSTNKIAKWNQISLKKPLFPGQKLVIKTTDSTKLALSSSANPFQSIRYTVKKGDSLAYISRKYNVLLADLRKWNAGNLGKHIHPGQKLKVLVNTGSQPST